MKKTQPRNIFIEDRPNMERHENFTTPSCIFSVAFLSVSLCLSSSGIVGFLLRTTNQSLTTEDFGWRLSLWPGGCTQLLNNSVRSPFDIVHVDSASTNGLDPNGVEWNFQEKSQSIPNHRCHHNHLSRHSYLQRDFYENLNPFSFNVRSYMRPITLAQIFSIRSDFVPLFWFELRSEMQKSSCHLRRRPIFGAGFPPERMGECLDM